MTLPEEKTAVVNFVKRKTLEGPYKVFLSCIMKGKDIPMPPIAFRFPHIPVVTSLRRTTRVLKTAHESESIITFNLILFHIY